MMHRILPLAGLPALCLTSPTLCQDGIAVDTTGRGQTIVSSSGTHLAASTGSAARVALFDLAGGWRAIDAFGTPLEVADGGAAVLTGLGLWTEAGGFGPLGGPSGASPIDMSADGGHVLAYAQGQGPAGSNDTFVLDRATGGLVWLQGDGSATVLSDDGSVAAGRALVGGVERAVAWDCATGARSAIDDGTSGAATAALATSSDGAWVTGRAVTSLGTQPFRWSAGTGLEVLPPSWIAGGVDGAGVWIDDAGTGLITRRAVAGSLFEFDSDLWQEGVGARPLGEVIEASGLSPYSAGNPTASDGVSADGRVLAVVPVQGPEQSVFVLDARVSTPFCGPAVPNSTGSAASLRLVGSDAADAAHLVLRAAQLVPLEAALPFTSRTTDLAPGAGGSVGTLCLGGAIGRLPVGAADATGALELGIDPAALPQGGGAVPAMSGETWHFQVWYRDPAGGGSNFTDGASLTFL